MRHHFQTQQWVPYPRQRVFAFFSDPANLPPLMPRWQRARVERTRLSSGSIAGEGSLIVISFRPVPFFPLRLKWEAYVAEFQWNEFFCDEQKKGPFQYFRHCHRVVDAERDGIMGSIVEDSVEYELPLGMLGDLANSLAMKRQIAALFAYRQKRLVTLLAQG